MLLLCSCRCWLWCSSERRLTTPPSPAGEIPRGRVSPRGARGMESQRRYRSRRCHRRSRFCASGIAGRSHQGVPQRPLTATRQPAAKGSTRALKRAGNSKRGRFRSASNRGCSANTTEQEKPPSRPGGSFPVERRLPRQSILGAIFFVFLVFVATLRRSSGRPPFRNGILLPRS